MLKTCRALVELFSTIDTTLTQPEASGVLKLTFGLEPPAAAAAFRQFRLSGAIQLGYTGKASSFSKRDDLAPRFYPVLSSPVPLDLPGWAVAATGAGAEPSA
ncbi:hypothetical protein ACVWXO_000284 [Bradyrhizobium sp. LM2.7]